MAIDRETVIAARARPGGEVRVRSLDAETPERLVAAVAAEIAARGGGAGIDAVLASDVPVGSGLSSSAAFELACAVALAGASRLILAVDELARACRDAEEYATGVPCGIMDQYAAAAGRAGHALLLDCRTLEVEHVPLPDAVEVLVVHSGIGRSLEGSAYAERRRAVERAAERLGLRALRDASPEQVQDDPLARHVVSEIARVREAAAALREGRLARLGELLCESHASLRDDFGVSTPELDELVSALVAAGALGARLTGAGMGGCVVALVERGSAGAVSQRACARYRERTGRDPDAFLCRAADGASPIDAPVRDGSGTVRD